MRKYIEKSLGIVIMSYERKDFTQQLIKKIFIALNNDDTRKYLQIYLIDPLLSHVLEQIFPYIIITSVLFIILILSIVTICIFIYYHIRISTAKL